jgi:hypothetical protein
VLYHTTRRVGRGNAACTPTRGGRPTTPERADRRGPQAVLRLQRSDADDPPIPVARSRRTCTSATTSRTSSSTPSTS